MFMNYVNLKGLKRNAAMHWKITKFDKYHAKKIKSKKKGIVN